MAKLRPNYEAILNFGLKMKKNKTRVFTAVGITHSSVHSPSVNLCG